MNLKNKKILITGASFIGIHLIEKLIKEKVGYIRVVNLTDEKKELIKRLYGNNVEFQALDLRDISLAKKALKNIDIVVHLAADHGGRGYVALRQGKTATNFLLDGAVFKACLDVGVEKVFYASSGCVYPNYLQDSEKEIYLKEDDVKPPYDADNLYGWAKLMGELTLKKYYQDYRLKSAIGRFFTVYGSYAKESHAVIATIAKAFIKQDPFFVWGTGEQIRNWTYVEDIVDGIILMIKNIDNALSINLGTQERIKVKDMVQLVFKYTNFYTKKIVFQKNMPEGPKNRVADISLAKKLLNWQPEYKFEQGLKKIVDWYFATKNRDFIKNHLDKLLI